MGKPRDFKPSPHLQPSPSTSTSGASLSTPYTMSTPNIITYRLNGSMVYVTPPESFEQAVNFAREVFPEELQGVDSSQISFSVTAMVGGTKQSVLIGPRAWKATMAGLERYEIVHVVVRPQLIVDDVDGPPNYLEASKDTKNHDRSRTPSPSPLKSRSPSPCPRISRSPSPSSLAGRAVDWLERRLSDSSHSKD